MNYDKMKYTCECCGKKFTEGAIIPNEPAKKKISLCVDCYTDLEVYVMIHTPITKWIKKIKELEEKKEAE